MRIPLFGLGLRGQSRAVTPKRAKNFYFEFRPEGEKARVVAYGFPGRTLFVDFGDTPIRGMYAQGDYLYVVHRGTFWEVNNAGVKTSRGTIGTVEGRVSIASNGSQIMLVDGDKGYIYTVATHTLAEITDADFFSNPVTVTFQDGYFICAFADSGRFQISDLYDGTTWDALDFANAESSPDNLMAAIADHGEICLFGEATSEFWGNTGAEDFPYSNIRGTSIERGLAARWSLAKFNDALAFLGKNVAGQVQVYMLRGHTPVPISTPDLDAVINQYPAVADATALAFNWFGHPFYILNFPSANASWLYDGSTGIWSELSENEGRWAGEIHCDYINQPRISDSSNGRIYTLSAEAYTNNGDPIVGELIGETVTAPDGQRFTADCIRLEMETGLEDVRFAFTDPMVIEARNSYLTHSGDWKGVNLQPVITVSRPSEKTYFDKDGVLQTAADNEWPLEYDPVTLEPLGRSVWEARTNLLTHSEAFDNAAWTKNNVAIVPNSVLAPDGLAFGDKLGDASGDLQFHGCTQYTTAVSSDGVFTGSVFVKAADRPFFIIRLNTVGASGNYVYGQFDLSTQQYGAGNVGAAAGATSRIENVGGGWYRCSVSGTPHTGAGGTGVSMEMFTPLTLVNSSNYAGVVGEGIYIWGAQLEAGSSASPYIPTSGSAVTRSADMVSITGGDFSSWFNPTEGTFVVEAVANAGGTPDESIYVQATDGTSSNAINLMWTAGAFNRASAQIVTGGASQTSGINEATNATPRGTLRRLAFAFRANDAQLAAEGQLVGAHDTSINLPAVDRLAIGSHGALGNRYLNGHIRRIAYYPKRLSNADLQTLSAGGEITTAIPSLDVNFTRPALSALAQLTQGYGGAPDGSKTWFFSSDAEGCPTAQPVGSMFRYQAGKSYVFFALIRPTEKRMFFRLPFGDGQAVFNDAAIEAWGTLDDYGIEQWQDMRLVWVSGIAQETSDGSPMLGYVDAIEPGEGTEVWLVQAERGEAPSGIVQSNNVAVTADSVIVKTAQGPQVMLQVSRDGGFTWGNELWRSAGKVGQYGRRVEWRRLGTADRLTPKIRITDNCKRVILGAVLNPSD